MAAAKSTRWSTILGRVEVKLEQIANQDATTGKVVTMPRSLDKLLEQIKATKDKLETARAKQTDLDQQWTEFEQEKDRLTAEYQQEQAGIIEALTRLQSHFADIAAEAGLQCVLPRGQSEAE